MSGNLVRRFLVILFAMGLATYFLAKNGIKLGLDLAGGMYLAVEVSDPEGTLTEQALPRARSWREGPAVRRVRVFQQVYQRVVRFVAECSQSAKLSRAIRSFPTSCAPCAAARACRLRRSSPHRPA